MLTYRFVLKETVKFTAVSSAALETQTTKAYNIFSEEFHLKTSNIQDEVRVTLLYGGRIPSLSRLWASVGTLTLLQRSAGHEDTLMSTPRCLLSMSSCL